MKRYAIWIWCALFSLAISSIAATLAISGAATLRHIPPGTIIPDDAIEVYFATGLGGALLGLVLAFPLAVTTIIFGHKKPAAWLIGSIAVLLSLTPWPAGAFVGRYYIADHNLSAGR